MIKKYLKNKDGMALPMVLIIMLILTILAAGLGTYASQSLRMVKYMDAQKQAYYLARAGVEAGAFAYQNATTKTSSHFNSNDDFKNGLAQFTAVDKLVTILEDSDEKVTSNKVYLVYDESAVGSGNMWDGLSFKAYTPENLPKNADGTVHKSVIGYFYIEAGRAKQDTIVKEVNPATGLEEEKTVKKTVIEFKSTAVCFNDDGSEVTRVTSGFVYPDQIIGSETCYAADGTLSTNTADFDAHDTKRVTYNDTNAFDTKTGKWWQRLQNGLLKLTWSIMKNAGFIPEYEDITVYEMIGGGDLVLSPPSGGGGEIKINDGEHNFYIFSTPKTLIVKDTGFNVIPSKGKYATIGLYGSDIVVDGDIKMAVYHTQTTLFGKNLDNALLKKLQSFIETLGNRYRLGTVMIGSGAKSSGQWAEYLTYSQGGITNQNKQTIDNANRIFFNGNVTVTIYSYGSQTETYRIFSAGDICLFNGMYSVQNQAPDSNQTVETRGIDLVKYFLDAVIAGEEGFVLGDSAKKKMKEIRDLYYGDPADATNPGEPSYFANGTRPMRKLNVDFTNAKIDGKPIATTKVNDIDLIEYIQQPTSAQSSDINWGKPSDPNPKLGK